MKFIIDTHCWLWWFLEPKKLGESSYRLIATPNNTVYFSAASSWEIAIKYGSGKLPLPQPPKEYIPSRLTSQGMSSLPIQHSHTLQAGDLPHHHRDPFDRLLIAQAQIEKLPIMTADEDFKSYDVEIIWARPNGAKK